jgi:DNA-binding transcriptional ArsR family regulator
MAMPADAPPVPSERHDADLDDERLDAVFTALADPTRRAILARLAQGEASVLELAAPFEISQPAVSKHIKMLERAGLVSRHRDAQRRPCRLEAGVLAEAVDYLERYRQHWEANFRRLDAVLDELRTEQHTEPHTEPHPGGTHPQREDQS